MYQMTMPGYRIDLVWYKGSLNHRQAQGGMEQGWLHIVFKAPDLTAAYKYLQDRGTDAKTDLGPHGEVTHLTLHDPEGNEIGIVRQ